MELVNAITEYEQGLLDHEDTVELFQELVDTGLAWQLQGSYGRMAMHLIKTGEIHPVYNRSAIETEE